MKRKPEDDVVYAICKHCKVGICNCEDCLEYHPPDVCAECAEAHACDETGKQS